MQDNSSSKLLNFGIYSSLFYMAMNIVMPFYFDGYSFSTHTVSELSALGAPTRTPWLILSAVYDILFVTFAWGVLKVSGKNGYLRVTAFLMLAYGVLNIYWPPMHLRGVAPTPTDTLHIVWTTGAVLLMMLMMIFGAVALGRAFRWYTGFTLVINVIFGYLAGMHAANIPIDGPTPYMGMWERVNIGVFMLWVIVLAMVLRRPADAAAR